MMDFVLGSLFFFIFGFAIMHGTDWNGIIGIKGFFNPTTLADADGLFNGLPIGVLFSIQYSYSYPVLWQKYKILFAYLLYSAAISIFIYPVTSLDLGRWMACSDGIPRFCRFHSSPYGRRYLCSQNLVLKI